MSGVVSMASCLATIIFDSTPPQAWVFSEERVEVPDSVDFLVHSDKPIVGRSYTFVDSGGETYRLGYAEEAEGIDRVSLPSVEMAYGRGILFIVLTDDVGNETRLQQQVAVVSYSPFDAALGLQRVIIGTAAHQPVYRTSTGAEGAA